MRPADVLAFLGLLVVLLAVTLQLTGRNNPDVRVTPVSVTDATSHTTPDLHGT